MKKLSDESSQEARGDAELPQNTKDAIFTLSYQAGRFLSTHDDVPLILFHWLTFPPTALSFYHLFFGLVLIGEESLAPDSPFYAVLYAALIWVWFPTLLAIYGFVSSETKLVGVYYFIYLFGGYILTAVLVGLETTYIPFSTNVWLRPVIGVAGALVFAVGLQIVVGHLWLHGHPPVRPEGPEWYPGVIDILQRTFQGVLMLIMYSLFTKEQLTPREMDIMYTTKEHFKPESLRQRDEAKAAAGKLLEEGGVESGDESSADATKELEVNS